MELSGPYRVSQLYPPLAMLVFLSPIHGAVSYVMERREKWKGLPAQCTYTRTHSFSTATSELLTYLCSVFLFGTNIWLAKFPIFLKEIQLTHPTDQVWLIRKKACMANKEEPVYCV